MRKVRIPSFGKVRAAESTLAIHLEQKVDLMLKLKHLQRCTLSGVDFKEHTEFEGFWNLEHQQKCFQSKISVRADCFSVMIKKKRGI